MRRSLTKCQQSQTKKYCFNWRIPHGERINTVITYHFRLSLSEALEESEVPVGRSRDGFETDRRGVEWKCDGEEILGVHQESLGCGGGVVMVLGG